MRVSLFDSAPALISNILEKNLNALPSQGYKALLGSQKDKRLRDLIDKTGLYMDGISTMLSKSRGEGAEAGEGYYSVAHRKREEVCQPGMLRGGVLKDYQVRGNGRC